MRTFLNLTVILAINFCLVISLSVFGQEESTKAEIFNYEIGDIFHTYYWDRPTGYLDYEAHSTYYILDKYYSPSGDTLFYAQEIFREINDIGLDTNIYENYIDTLEIIDLNSMIWGGDADSVYSDPSFYNGRLINSVTDIYYNDFVWTYWYIVGCGGPYSYEPGLIEGAGSGRDLVYFLKGDEEWGTPYYVSIPEKIESKNQIKIYPNPASNYIHFAWGSCTSNDIQVSVFTNYGECIKALDLSSGKNQINISDLANGFYTIRILDNSNIFFGKFIKN